MIQFWNSLTNTSVNTTKISAIQKEIQELVKVNKQLSTNENELKKELQNLTLSYNDLQTNSTQQIILSKLDD
jgi:regulator of replication initiation timing